jgi:hypothetical protein
MSEAAEILEFRGTGRTLRGDQDLAVHDRIAAQLRE